MARQLRHTRQDDSRKARPGATAAHLCLPQRGHCRGLCCHCLLLHSSPCSRVLHLCLPPAICWLVPCAALWLRRTRLCVIFRRLPVVVAYGVVIICRGTMMLPCPTSWSCHVFCLWTAGPAWFSRHHHAIAGRCASKRTRHSAPRCQVQRLAGPCSGLLQASPLHRAAMRREGPQTSSTWQQAPKRT